MADLASARGRDRGGLRKAADWPQLEQIEIDRPIMIIAPMRLASRGGDATSLRGSDRSRARLVDDVELDGGHCLHRDLSDEWLRVVTAFAG